MLSFPFLEDTFKAVLGLSQAIQGRFHVCAKYGVEINSDQFQEVLLDLVEDSAKELPRYPLGLMMPPRSSGFYSKSDGWDDYTITMFFLKQSFVDSQNAVQSPNVNTGTSTHTVPQDWHDMKRAAVGFLRALETLQRKKGTTILSRFRLSGTIKHHITPVSFLGNDRAAGVRLDFNASLFIGCDLEDYDQAAILALDIPFTDSHPQHQL